MSEVESIRDTDMDYQDNTHEIPDELFFNEFCEFKPIQLTHENREHDCQYVDYVTCKTVSFPPNLKGERIN